MKLYITGNLENLTEGIALLSADLGVEIAEGGYTLTGYYDLPPSSGGQIRVLVAVAK